mgnify:FL=1
MKEGLLIVFAFFILSLLQVSFLPHFPILGWVINIVLLSLILVAALGSVKIGVEAALTGGFFLDIYSHLPFGFWMILSLTLFFIIRYIVRNYVRLPQYI